MKIDILVSKYTPKRINRNMFSKSSSWEILHSKRLSKIFIFYIKRGNFWKKIKTKSDQNTHSIVAHYQKRTKLHRFKKFSRGSMTPNPPNNAHGFTMSSMSLRDMQIHKSENKNSWLPLPNPGDAPEIINVTKIRHSTTLIVS